MRYSPRRYHTTISHHRRCNIRIASSKMKKLKKLKNDIPFLPRKSFFRFLFSFLQSFCITVGDMCARRGQKLYLTLLLSKHTSFNRRVVCSSRSLVCHIILVALSLMRETSK